MFASFISILAATVAPNTGSAVQQPSPDRDIVVTSRRLDDTARELKACIARRCDPLQDMSATLTHAENEFVAGEYRAARRTLAAGIGRNRQYAERYPEPVAGLMRANGRIAMHEGDVDQYRLQLLDMADVLRNHLPAGDLRVLGARLEVADAFARQFRYDLAHRRYAEVARDADAAGLKKVQGMALLRIANLRVTQALADPAGWTSSAERSIAALTTNADPGLAPFAAAANVLTARLAEKAGDTGAVDRFIARYASTNRETKPVLLSTPTIDLEKVGLRRPVRAGGTRDAITGLSTLPSSRTGLATDADPEWVDVSFWIGADGKVTDVDLLRTSSNFAGRWDEAVTKAIGERRYAPITLTTNEGGLLRVERYTFRYDEAEFVGSRIKTRNRELARIEMLDLTAEPAQMASR